MCIFQMKRVIVLFVIFSLVILGFFYARRYREGFTSSPDVENALVSIVSQMKRMTKHLADPAMLMDRLEMFSMSPIELARRHLQKV